MAFVDDGRLMAPALMDITGLCLLSMLDVPNLTIPIFDVHNLDVRNSMVDAPCSK